MTRVSSYTLYQCPSCGQVHIKNEYGSVSIYVPTDLYFDPTDEKSCQTCHKTFLVKDFICLGIRSKKVSIEKIYSNTIWGKFFKTLLKPFSQPREVDLNNLFPYL
jgi:hypothetical protein